MRDFRFSCNVFAIRSGGSFTEYCRTAERYGYDAIFTADHLGSPAPFSPLIAAAEATQRLRVGTLVLNIGFWNPHLLAREVATADLLTGGRLELGVGAGHMKWEFDAAGLPWRPLPERADMLEAALDELERIFASDGYPERNAANELLETPFALIGTVDEIAGQLRQRREELGFSFITVHEPYMTTFGPVIERLRNEPG